MFLCFASDVLRWISNQISTSINRVYKTQVTNRVFKTQNPCGRRVSNSAIWKRVLKARVLYGTRVYKTRDAILKNPFKHLSTNYIVSPHYARLQISSWNPRGQLTQMPRGVFSFWPFIVNIPIIIDWIVKLFPVSLLVIIYTIWRIDNLRIVADQFDCLCQFTTCCQYINVISKNNWKQRRYV